MSEHTRTNLSSAAVRNAVAAILNAATPGPNGAPFLHVRLSLTADEQSALEALADVLETPEGAVLVGAALATRRANDATCPLCMGSVTAGARVVLGYGVTAHARCWDSADNATRHEIRQVLQPAELRTYLCRRCGNVEVTQPGVWCSRCKRETRS